MNPAREVVLRRIREALEGRARPGGGRGNGPGGGRGSGLGDSPGNGPGYGPGEIPRSYRHGGHRSEQEAVELFQARLEDYGATVLHVGPGALGAGIARRLEAREVRRLAMPSDIPGSWTEDWAAAGGTIWRDEPASPLSNTRLEEAQGVLTGCALVLAETGTLVLDGGSTQGRRALSLLPDYHLCVVFARQVVETIPQAVRFCEAGQEDAFRPLTFISGPSATSDIELIRVEGVHGPRTLDVIVVEGV